MQAFQEYLSKNAIGGSHGSHYVYWIPIAVFNQLPIKMWKFNRPPDAGRIAEIREATKTAKRVDGLIYLAWVDDKLVCYEANHRREALKEDMPLNEMAPILVDILWNATDEMVKQEFLRLNKSISVPELYIEPTAEESITSVLRVVDAFCAKYPDLRSPSGRPQRPNYNRDKFTDEFVGIMRELRINSEELMSRLERLNIEMSRRDPTRLTMNVINKCRKSGLWLFAWSPSLDARLLGE
jgi:hypothetical protein